MVKSFLSGFLQVGAVVVILCGGFTGCRDNSSPDPGAIGRRNPPAATIRREAQLRSDMAWVGQAHNKALDDLRAEMRKPGMITNNMCQHLSSFASRADRFPDGRSKVQTRDRLSIAKSLLKDAKICKPEPVNSVSLQGEETYSNISTLLTEIENAIDLASDRYDLVQRLSSFWPAVAELSESESAIVAATLVTAQSSFEYWEVEVDRAYREFEAEYAECVRTSSSDGTDYEQARQFCLDGGVLPTLSPRYAPSPARIAGLSRRGCALSGHFKNLAKADAVGAFTGAIKGALSTGVAGIGGGALVGGIAGSAGSWINSAFELYACAKK